MNWKKIFPSKKAWYGPLYNTLAEEGLEWVYWLIIIGGIVAFFLFSIFMVLI